MAVARSSARLKEEMNRGTRMGISAFRRADELATAMECRCYQGGAGRTKMKLLRFHREDISAFGILTVLIAGVAVLANFGL